MKKLSILYLFAITVIAFVSCEELEHKPISSNTQTPQPISSPKVINKPGGATITYNLPDEEDILYVKAEYELANGRQYESRSSIYNDFIEVDGYGDTNEHVVSLYTVNRGGKTSEPTKVNIKPSTPPVYSVYNTITMNPDFGGVKFTWENENNAPLSFLILSNDPVTGELLPVETVYSGTTKGEYTLRGYDPEEREFAIVVRDRWDNFSDTIKTKTTPLFEMKLDKSKFNEIILPGDHDFNGWSGRYERVYDGLPNTYNHSSAGTGWPHVFTLDLGVIAKLSRVNVLARQDRPFEHGNPRIMEIWGIAEEPPTDGSWDGWTKLRDLNSTKPSDDGGTSDEDAAQHKNGEEFSFDLMTPSVRYVRFIIHETWGLTGFVTIAELTFYGQEI